MIHTTTQECTISRIFDAPRQLVYQGFVDADQLAQWWGPEGCSRPRETIESDARVGGHQRLVMRIDARPDVRVQNDFTFTEVIQNELLVAEIGVTGAPD